MEVDRRELHALLERISDFDLPVIRRVLQAMAVAWDVAPAEAEGEFTEQTLAGVTAAEEYFDNSGKGIPYGDILKEFGLG